MDNTKNQPFPVDNAQGAQVPNVVPNGNQQQEVEVSNQNLNLKMQGDIIHRQKEQEIALKAQVDQLAQENQKLMQQLQAGQVQQVQPQINATPQQYPSQVDEKVLTKIQELENFKISFQQREQQQAFQPIKEILSSYNISEPDHEIFLEQIKINYGVDLKTTPNPGLLNMILEKEYSPQPQTLPQGRGYAPNPMSFDQVNYEALHQQVQSKVDENIQRMKSIKGYK